MPSYVVTGANRGLGYAFVRHLADTPGNKVFGLVRNKKAAEERAATDGVDNVKFLEADIVDIQALSEAAHAVGAETGGALDVLINNAAWISPESEYVTLIDPTPEDLEKDLEASFHVNVSGVAHTINAFLRLIRKGEQKKIVVISTGAADLDFVKRFSIPVHAPYAISKAATNMLVAKYHAILGQKEGILVFAMSPGLVDTKEKELTEQEKAGYKAMVEMFREYKPSFTGAISPFESVTSQMRVIDSATVDSLGGGFVSHHGNKQWI